MPNVFVSHHMLQLEKPRVVIIMPRYWGCLQSFAFYHLKVNHGVDDDCETGDDADFLGDQEGREEVRQSHGKVD